ncbi:hypothetical protein JX266_008514 [Neoarthrinium moseri]|uniref:uncharacterized protein n=1 Tax=Neoarthrinium moseri TaxID=1658444 RepID=UPI001FDB4432|nr:uncharacterized protein JN550_012540 [Neoarthrinium moseri]KAI1845419.1 hypothetical protein JX266_008514 [Neoarthrinium moseri]KAI1858708.1 hypothetical protein JN550_012540 [Neoarthrinium moseri]
MDFIPRYREYQASRDQTEKLVKDLMIFGERIESTYRQENQTLIQRLQNTQFDYEDSVNSRRELQARIKDLESQLSFLTQDNTILQHRNPYVLVLIDGDGLIFKDHLIKQGLEGGKKAAYALRQAVLAQCTNAHDTEVVAKIVANLGGLAKAMRRDACVDSEIDLKEFMLGFTQAKASFDFIDVGYGKERADSKIRETASFNLRNYNCKQILLGVSHDAGYAPYLDEILRDESARQRVTVLEGVPTVKEIEATGVSIIGFDEIFRAEKLLDRITTTTIATPSMSTASTPSISAAPISYATITQKASPPPQLTLPLAPKAPAAAKATSTAIRTTGKPALPAWNPGARGLDPPIPLSQNVLDQVKKRKDSDKLCNNHYLRGPCSKGDSCCFEHDYRPNQEEIRAIQFLARLNPCTNGQDCDVDNCIYGHHCPSVLNGVCTHPYCKFHSHEHPPGTKLKGGKKAPE